jgi:effector-binding domain-containing protein
MITKPKIEHCFEQPYVAVRTALPIPFGKYLPQLWDEVFQWLNDKGKRIPGLAIIRYFTTDMSKRLDIDVGFLIDEVVSGDDRITLGFLPAGRYATLLYTGPYKGKGIYNATVALLE